MRIGDFIDPKMVERVKASCKQPTLEAKLKVFDGMAQETNWRSFLGNLVNTIFNETLVLPHVYRRQQIVSAIKYGRKYLVENPETGIYMAVLEGCKQEYNEWKMFVGNITEEEQIALLSNKHAQKPEEAQQEEQVVEEADQA